MISLVPRPRSLVASLFIGAAAATSFLTGSVLAQPLPLPRSFDVMVCDSAADAVVRLADLNQDGMFTQVGEWTSFYDGTGGGPVLSNPASLAFDARGRLFITDATTDMVLLTIDRSGDGAATAMNEWNIYIDNTNLSGVTFTSVLTIRTDANGTLWGVNAGAGTLPLDFVFRATDINNDEDCNDAGEIVIVYDSTAGAVNIAVPSGLAIDPTNGDLYVSDVNPDAIYRLRDADLNGDYYGVGEVTTVYTGTMPGPGLSNANTLSFASNGDLFVNDSLLDAILRLRDGNANGDFEDAGEATVFADQSGNSFGVPANQFGIEVDEHGRIFAVENSAGDYVVLYDDANADGDANDPGEVTILYDDAVGPGTIGTPRALALVPAPLMSTPAGATIPVGQILSLDLKGHDSDTFQVLFGISSLGGPQPLPPYGTISYLPLFLNLFTGTLDAQGTALLPLSIPSTVPTPLPVWFSAAMGKPPYRYFLSTEVMVTIIP